MSTYVEKAVTARQRHMCENYPTVTHRIERGDKYLVATEYPGGESGFADAAGHPVRIKICADCAGSDRMARLTSESQQRSTRRWLSGR